MRWREELNIAESIINKWELDSTESKTKFQKECKFKDKK